MLEALGMGKSSVQTTEQPLGIIIPGMMQGGVPKISTMNHPAIGVSPF